MTGTHVKIGFLALCLALLLAVPTLLVTNRPNEAGARTDIAVEHDAPITIRIVRLGSTGSNILELSHNGSGSIAVQLPVGWTRQEVRGVPLSSVTSSSQEWSYVRWTIPRGATVRFDALTSQAITLHNPSGVPLTVRTTVVDGDTMRREDDAVIVTTDPYPLP